MNLGLYLLSALALVGAAFLVFRVLVQRDYERINRLTPLTGLTELLVWALFFGFPYLYNPPEWASFWSDNVPVGTPLRIAGLVLIALGFASAFGTMLWFGLRRAFGQEVDRLVQSGPYRISRNPQLVGGSLLVIGTALLWPSWYALGWIALYGVVAHMMVITEEENLHRVFGEEYARYCKRVPRYIGLMRSDR
jgi:protein-S-isoprenylcysteine O-methyltransferase Ste14